MKTYWGKVAEERDAVQRKRQEQDVRREKDLRGASRRVNASVGRDNKAKGERRYAARFTPEGVVCRSCKKHKPEDRFGIKKDGRLNESCRRCSHKRYLIKKAGPKATPSVERAVRARNFETAVKRYTE